MSTTAIYLFGNSFNCSQNLLSNSINHSKSDHRFDVYFRSRFLKIKSNICGNESTEINRLSIQSNNNNNIFKIKLHISYRLDKLLEF